MRQICGAVLLPGLLLSTPAVAGTLCGAPGDGWAHSRTAPPFYVNVLVLQQATPSQRPTWNGTPVTEANVREYLGVTTQMRPIPVFELVVSPQADCREVDKYRNMAKQILKCTGDRCVEVDL